MAEYIERAKAIERIRPHVKPTTVYGEGYMQAIEHATNILELIPAANVQPVKRGFWKALMMSEETGWNLSLTGGYDAVCEYVCSVCGKPAIVDEFGEDFLPDYCPCCGARMDLKDGDENENN